MPFSDRLDLLEWIQKRTTETIRGLEHFFCEERLRELEFFRLEERRFREDLIVAFQYLKVAHKKNGDKLFSRASCNSTRSN